MDRGPRSSRPVDPAASEWSFPSIDDLPSDDDLVAVGADLEPGTLLAAYTRGFFPMPVNRRTIGWFHPDPRGVIPLDGLRVTRSLRRSARRYTTTVNRAFDQVIAACADPSRPLGWIDGRIVRAYTQLHHMGWAHSVEAWDDEGLAGGLYGVAIGGLFAGESMFHRRTDASKVALVRLVELLGGRPGALLDVQWVTPHLASLGAVDVSRRRYVEALEAALRVPPAPLPPPPDLVSGRGHTPH
jgi:leucyl/phenylalanyl-tRNA--protein transferase